MECELCGRSGVTCTVHHLTPKEEGGTFEPTANLCVACHKQIHALYSNQELAIRLNTVRKLKEDEKIRRFLKWIKKQPPTKRVKVSKSNEKNRKK
ncbi:HNH endonuclease [Guptibacillus algicola]|uniref:HNH endonuclease n=1 Tax=Guptibacillus algicola TaxID=225844 RepID=UPI001CD2E5E6|nr:HNH endonuclease [Alkalihalobacillus algicola]MCA0987645.1 HNH endonuclease [Alkalihalobacillus algicola]